MFLRFFIIYGAVSQVKILLCNNNQNKIRYLVESSFYQNSKKKKQSKIYQFQVAAPIDVNITANRPDIILISKIKKQAYLVNNAIL